MAAAVPWIEQRRFLSVFTFLLLLPSPAFTSPARVRPPTARPAAPSARADRPSPSLPAASLGPGARSPALQPFSADSPWNTPLGQGAELEPPEAPCTQALRDPQATSDLNAAEWSHPIHQARPTDPLVRIFVDGELKAKVRVPADAQPALPRSRDSDGHLHILDPSGRWVDELWRARRNKDGSLVAQAYHRNDLYGPGIEKGGVRAYGGSAIAGLIRRGELAAGIRHALALALPRRLQKRGPVWPATLEDDGAEADYRGAVPMGQLVALPRDLDLKGLGLGPQGLLLGRALQDFGAYDVDSSGDISLYAEPAAEDELGTARADWAKLRLLIRCVRNSGKGAAGGPGARVAPAVQPLGAAPAAAGAAGP
ncbi:MAG: hypothetical protein U1A78_12340 [Polyangia bacterium]